MKFDSNFIFIKYFRGKTERPNTHQHIDGGRRIIESLYPGLLIKTETIKYMLWSHHIHCCHYSTNQRRAHHKTIDCRFGMALLYRLSCSSKNLALIVLKFIGLPERSRSALDILDSWWWVPKNNDDSAFITQTPWKHSNYPMFFLLA